MEKHGTARRATDECLIIRRMRFACWITKATDIHSEYAILVAFPWLQWLPPIFTVCFIAFFLFAAMNPRPTCKLQDNLYTAVCSTLFSLLVIRVFTVLIGFVIEF